MSYNDTQYLPSTTPGMTWSVYTYKPDGRPGYACASEGVYEVGDNGFNSFTTRLFQDRVIRENIPGRMTVKNRNAGLKVLIDKMTEAGMIPVGTPLKEVY